MGQYYFFLNCDNFEKFVETWMLIGIQKFFVMLFN